MPSPLASRQDVSRLFARAAFGATATDLATWTGRPYAEVVDALIAGPSLRTDAAADAERHAHRVTPTQLADAQGWWLERMRTAQHPLQERMTLLWHDHFATAVTLQGLGVPGLDHVLTQNETIRQHALGDFRSLLAAMNVDPAMLYWLNGYQSVPPKPNENYAREFLELFSLGVRPQVYSEQDIREAARAFTGWNVVNPPGVAAFDANRHDRGRKTVLGSTFADLGQAEHLELVRIVTSQPVASRFIAAKLVGGLAHELPVVDLLREPTPLVARVADVLRSTSWDIAAAVRTILLSDEFRSDQPQHRRVRQPVELAVHGAKVLGVDAGGAGVLEALGRMGQKPFQPPNVGGWPVGVGWLSPAATIARYDLGLVLARLAQAAPAAQLNGPLPASGDLAGWVTRLGMFGLAAITERTARDYLGSRSGAPEAEKQAGIVAILTTSPEWTVV